MTKAAVKVETEDTERPSLGNAGLDKLAIRRGLHRNRAGTSLIEVDNLLAKRSIEIRSSNVRVRW
jgi:hypothetical protein